MHCTNNRCKSFKNHLPCTDMGRCEDCENDGDNRNETSEDNFYVEDDHYNGK